MKPVNELTYTEAVGELEAIVAKLRSDNCDFDSLPGSPTATDTELRAILDSLQQ